MSWVQTGTHLYHEKQLSALCGVHALNNLLQGPVFGAGDLAEIANGLDAEEAALLDTPPPPSQRVDPLTGDFNIDVLSAALLAHELQLIDADHAEVVERMMTAPQEEEAFLLHVRAHWFVLRTLGGMWWNVDSRLERPILIAHDALGRGLAQLRADGQTVYVVRHASGASSIAPPLRRGTSFSAGREDVWHPIDYLLSQCAPRHSPRSELTAPCGL